MKVIIFELRVVFAFVYMYMSPFHTCVHIHEQLGPNLGQRSQEAESQPTRPPHYHQVLITHTNSYLVIKSAKILETTVASTWWCKLPQSLDNDQYNGRFVINRGSRMTYFVDLSSTPQLKWGDLLNKVV